MSPLILVGLLAFATLNPALADVKHVLEGSAHPPDCKCAQANHHHYQNTDNHYSGSFQGSGGFPVVPNHSGAANNVVPGSVAFWWADSNSPFKHAYDHFKKCSLKGNCFPPVAPGFVAPQSGCGPSGCTVTGSIDLKGNAANAGNIFGAVDIKKNPFLNGQINGVGGAGGHKVSTTYQEQGHAHFDISGNPFLNGGQAAFSGNGQAVVTGSDGFLGVQPSVPFGKGGSKVQPFPTAVPTGGSFHFEGTQSFSSSHPSQPGGQPGVQPFPSTLPSKDGKFQNCQQAGYVCVAQEQCVNGFVKAHGQGLQQNSVEYCEIGKEVCCRVPEGAGSSYQPGGSTSSFSSYTSSSGHGTSGQFGGAGVTQGTSGQFGISGANQGTSGQFGGSGISHTTSGQFSGNAITQGASGQFGTSGAGFGTNGQFGGADVSHTTSGQFEGSGTTGQFGVSGANFGTNGQFGGAGAGASHTTSGQFGGSGTSGKFGGSETTGQFGVSGANFGTNGQFGGASHTTSGQFGGSGISGKFGGSGTTGQFGVSGANFGTNGQFGGASHTTSGQFGGSGTSGQFGGSGSTGQFGVSGLSHTTSGQFGASSASHTTSGQYSTSGQFGASGVLNVKDVAAGKSSIPGSTIKFGGAAGLSPGTIQVLSPNEPNPSVSTAGESGNSGTIHHSVSTLTNKVVRNTTPNPNSIFSSTVDYSNDKLDQLSFVSTIRGPAYLPPHSTPVPPSHTPDLETPHISTYRPSIPTTSRPFVTRPVIPGSSIVSVYTEKPFIPSSPKPFDKPNQYLPPHSPSPQPTPYPTRPSISITQPPFTRAPTFPTSYLPPRPTPNTYVPPVTPARPTPKPYSPPTFKPYSPSTYQPVPQPDQPASQVTGGYSYPTPTPAFEYPTKPTPRPYTPPKPTQYLPPVKPQPTPGYDYPKPSPPFEIPSPSNPIPNFNINNEYKPTRKPQPTPGYSYPTPTPPFNYPSPSNPPPITVPPYKPTGYLPPKPENIPDGSVPNINIVPKPYVPKPYIPPLEPTGSNEVPNIIRPTPPPVPHAGCAAALRCVEERFCTADGFISQTPVVFTRDSLRVPTTDCSDSESGIIGKCCRDPNYVDPWPSANLINGVDNGQYREDPRMGQYFPQKQRPVRSESSGNAQNLLAENSARYPSVPQFNVQAQAVVPEPFNVQPAVDNTCGLRNPNAQPRGPGPIDAAFGEIPWQAMVLRDSNRSLLCGGVIVKANAVLTAAHCVEGLLTSDILIKGGEWKLGIDEEPLPFQIVKVAAIIRHPNYQPGSLANDLALLMLEEKLRIVGNVAPICLPQPNEAPSGQCISTGWGKQILQVHLRGAIMRSITVNLLDSNQCSETLSNKFQNALQNFAPNTVCCYSQNDQCDVDYGSALACTNGNGQYTLAGVFSWDTGCNDPAQIGGYIAPDVEWIELTCSKPLTHLKALDRQYRRNQ